MSPEQITEALEEIISNIADAHILIYRLKNALEAAAKADQAVDVVYSDIWTDANLSEINKRLRTWEYELARTIDMILPQHFERLRKGAA